MCVCLRACVCRLAPGRAAVAQDCEGAAGKCLCHRCHPGRADTQSSSHGHILGPGRSPNTLTAAIPLLAPSGSHSASPSLLLSRRFTLWCLHLSCVCVCLLLLSSNTHTLSRAFFFLSPEHFSKDRDLLKKKIVFYGLETQMKVKDKNKK